MKELRLIITGGTFDKHYDEIQGKLTFRESHLPRILKQSRCTLTVEIEQPCHLIDSLYMKEENRIVIASSCVKSPEEKVIVIHGTDTMVKTAEVIAKNLPADDKHIIVITGAMIPYALENSDSVFNLGCAVSAVQMLKPGVWVCMSGKIFDWNNVVKNKILGVFETIH